MKSNYIVRAQKLMRDFVPYMRKYSIGVAVEKFNRDKHRAIQYCCGSVRRCLVTSDYVVKWDYDGEHRRMFGGCVEEYKMYQKIKEHYYSYLFADITRIEVRGRVFYVMPRVKVAYDLDYWDIDDFLSDDERDFLYDEMGIGDLHSENWGMLEGQAVIIDYAYSHES